MRSAPTSSVECSAAIGGPPSAHLIQIRDLIYRVAGIFQPDSKLRPLESRCSQRMQTLGIATLRDYYQWLTINPAKQAELAALLNEITVGETCFFRNQPQLDALRSIVLPRIVAAKSNLLTRHLRIWSAGCSTGEEAYTLGMILREETSARLAGWTFEILATDLNERSLAHAAQGLYGEYSTRHLPEYFRRKYFVSSGDNLQINPDVQTYVKFSRVNFVDNASMVSMNDLDVIFCCNVLIYFHGAAKNAVIQHFYRNLLPHGYLFLGHSESLYGLDDNFRLVHLPSAIAYVKSENKESEASVKI